MSETEKRGSLYLFTGVFIGFLIGIFYSKVMFPVQYVNTIPGLLKEDAKSEYRILIALAFQIDGDTGRAFSRLSLLQDEKPLQALTEQAQKMVAKDGVSPASQALANLATQLERYMSNPQQSAPPLTSPTQQPSQGQPSQESGSLLQEEGDVVALLPGSTAGAEQFIFTATFVPTLTPTPMATFTPRPTATVLAALGKPFMLESQNTLCDRARKGLLQVEVQDEEGQPLPGAQVNITWKDGEEFFFTGLYPQVSPGYADFLMKAGETYFLRVGESGEVVHDLLSPECEDENGEIYSGAVSLFFKP